MTQQERDVEIVLMLGWKNSFAHKIDQYGYYQTVDGYSTPYRNTLDEQAVEYQSDKNAFAVEDLQFQTDWNWLMDAIEFIEKLEYEFHGKIVVYINGNNCTIQGSKLRTNPENFHPALFMDFYGKDKIEVAFIAVSDFAKLYNNKEL
jgi:hypothetical protein